MNKNIEILDSTLRDGAQSEGITFSPEDKLKIVEILDNLGVAYIEGGNPASNKKDMEFFKRVNMMYLKNSKVCAFGSTRKPDIKAEDDENLKAVLESKAAAAVIFGKSWLFHVEKVLKTTPEENLKMIYDTISYLTSKGLEVIFDAEHFFDGLKDNFEYAMKTVEYAIKAGARTVCLCDTNGGAFPKEISDGVKSVAEKFGVKVGVHCHNDCEMAVAGSISAVLSGACHVQGTLLGFGERCGNANLSSVISNLQLKRDYTCIKGDISQMTQSCKRLAEIANISLDNSMPYVGKSAFAHKGGMHIDGVMKDCKSFEHIEPAAVGNKRRFLTSEFSGRGTLIEKIRKIEPSITKEDIRTKEIIEEMKNLEYEGYQFEAAEQSVELLILKKLGKYKKSFELLDFKTIAVHSGDENNYSATAMIKIMVDGKTEITAAEGMGPVNALDKALRKALSVFYPSISKVHLTDYKVRVLEENNATASKVRVLIESTDGIDSWATVGVSTDVIEASWIALADSIEYKLSREKGAIV